ncbi:hypothetical protein Plhal304r1_c027g0091441 [Plasmopara halstedii]
MNGKARGPTEAANNTLSVINMFSELGDSHRWACEKGCIPIAFQLMQIITHDLAPA